jgi:hypothetical protein
MPPEAAAPMRFRKRGASLDRAHADPRGAK